MAYLSKESVLKAYKKLSEIDASIRQGTTQRVSALRYFLALDRFYKERSNDCDLKVATDKSFFTQCVGEIVAISDNYYTTNFYFPLPHKMTQTHNSIILVEEIIHCSMLQIKR